MRPPKSVDELAREQGLADARPDYRALATGVWETEEELSDFTAYLKQLRRSATA